MRSLVHRGGLRARLLNSALIRVGDAVTAVEEQDGVGVLVLREPKVLLGRRLSAHGYGTWSFPGGKPQRGEPAQLCALRELREDGFPGSRAVFRTTFVRVDAAAAGEPVAREPEKTARWDWFDWCMLPRPLFFPIDSLVATGYEPTTASS